MQKKKGISIEEAETELTRGALYNIDQGWKEAIDSKLDTSDIEKYNQAYDYLLSQTKNNSVDKVNSNFYSYTNSKGTIVVKARRDSYESNLSDAEQKKTNYYIGEVGKGFTATDEDFKNKDIFLTNTLAGSTNKDSAYYNDRKAFIQNSAAIKDSELDFLERFKSAADRDIKEVKGVVTGVVTGAKDTIIGIYEFAKNPIDNTNEIINSTKEAAKNPVQTAKNISEGIDQGLEKYNTTIDLYQMQKAEGAEAEYKANILGQVIGAGAAGKKGAEATVDAVKKAQHAAKEAEIAETLRKKQSVENNAFRDDFQQYDHYREEYAKNWKTGEALPDGNWNWAKEAPNDGAVIGTARVEIKKIGDSLDRFGEETGAYMAPTNIPLEQRSLPPGKNRPNALNQYVVIKPFESVVEDIAPAFGQPGGGTQIRARIPEIKNSFASIEQLKQFRYLKDK